MRRVQGEHTPNAKNRSSKQLSWLTKIRPVVKSMSNEQLKKMSSEGFITATKELNRRDKVRDKNEVRKQRYLENIAQKRNGVK